MPVDISFGDVSTAAYRIRSGVEVTPIRHSLKLSALFGMDVTFKKEFLLPTGSFKERGGLNALKLLDREARARGVIAASAGNHALALAYHGKRLGVPVTVVMPIFAPITKVQNCRDLGANVFLEGEHIGAAREAANKIAAEKGLRYINGFDDPHIIAGAGTMGMEIVDQVPELEAIVVPVGGGGLIAGVALAIKTLKPEVLIIGAEPENVPSMHAALEAGRPVAVPSQPTLADGLLVPRVGTNAFALARQHVDKVVLVKEKYIALAMLRLLELEKCVVEGGGAIGVAALLQGLLPELKGKSVVLPLCGGNVDIPVLGRVLERGLAADGRLMRFDAVTSDRPGGINNLTGVIAAVGASIKDIYHERAWLETSISQVRVRVVVEVSSREQGKALLLALRDSGYVVDAVSSNYQ